MADVAFSARSVHLFKWATEARVEDLEFGSLHRQPHSQVPRGAMSTQQYQKARMVVGVSLVLGTCAGQAKPLAAIGSTNTIMGW